MKFQKNREMTHQENLVSAQIDGGLHEKQALLDDFARAAMQTIVHAESPKDLMDKYHIAGIVSVSYDIAEAMMKERERRVKG